MGGSSRAAEERARRGLSIEYPSFLAERILQRRAIVEQRLAVEARMPAARVYFLVRADGSETELRCVLAALRALKSAPAYSFVGDDRGQVYAWRVPGWRWDDVRMARMARDWERRHPVQLRIGWWQ